MFTSVGFFLKMSTYFFLCKLLLNITLETFRVRATAKWLRALAAFPGPELDPYHPHGSSQPSLTPVSGDPTPSSGQYQKYIIFKSCARQSDIYSYSTLGTYKHENLYESKVISLRVRPCLSKKRKVIIH